MNALPPDDLDHSTNEPELRVADLDPDDAMRRFPGRRIMAFASPVVVLALVMTLFGLFHGSIFHDSSPQKVLAVPTRYSVPVLVPTSNVPTLPPAGQGWQNVGPANAVTLAFAPSAPEVGYTCNVLPHQQSSGTSSVNIGVSQDGGQSWRTSATPFHAGACDLSIDPRDANDIALFTGSDVAAQGSLYRSFDGGQTWRMLSLPPRANFNGKWLMCQMKWTTSTLFVTFIPFGKPQWRLLAASVNKGPLQWVDQNGLFNGMSSDAEISQLLADHGRILINVQYQNPCPPCGTMRASDDDGATWYTVTSSQVHGQAINIIGDNPDAQVLFGHIGEGPGNIQLLRSLDGGKHWDLLPSFPAGTRYDYPPIQTPGDALYLEISFANSAGAIYELFPHGRAWQLIAASPAGGIGSLAAVTWNDAGQAIGLWGWTASNANEAPILQRHAPYRTAALSPLPPLFARSSGITTEISKYF